MNTPPLLKSPTERQWLAVNAAAICGLAVFALYYLTAFRFGTLFADEARQVDFGMWYRLPPFIRDNLIYPSTATGDWRINFPYLPSAVALMLPLGAFPQPLAFALWMALQAASFAFVLWASIRLAGIGRWNARFLIAAAAVVVAGSPLGWDFRTHNNNVIYLALVMGALLTRRVWLAAILFALSANLKIYSGVVVPGLIWRREWRLALATVAAGLAVAIVLPALVFGVEGYAKLLVGWTGEVAYTMTAQGRAAAPVTLQKTVAALSGMAPETPAVIYSWRALQLFWIALVAGYFFLAARPRDSSDSAMRLADICVLLMLPLPLSTWFVPYQAVVMLPAFVLLIAVLCDPRWPRHVTGLAAAAIAVAAILRLAVRDWELRAGVYYLGFVFVVLALGAMRRAAAR